MNSTDLVQIVGALLIEKDISIACAESCTGGMFSSALTDVPGISSVFDRGIVTYSNRAKMEELGVSFKTLEKYDAVSAQTASEMASGLFRVCHCDICISVTGLAGPGGGTVERPVGLAFIGICYKGHTQSKRIFLQGRDRNMFREELVQKMLMIVQQIAVTGSDENL